MPPKVERNAEILRLRAAGWSLPQIARHVGLSYTRTQQIVAREHEKARRAGRSFYSLPTAAQTTLKLFLAEPNPGKRARMSGAEAPAPTDAQLGAMSGHDLLMYTQMPGVGRRSLTAVWELVERLRAEVERGDGRKDGGSNPSAACSDSVPHRRCRTAAHR